MNELSCKTFLDIRNDLKMLEVITEQDYIFANTIKELCSVRDGESFIDINISIVNEMICQLCIIFINRYSLFNIYLFFLVHLMLMYCRLYSHVFNVIYE